MCVHTAAERMPARILKPKGGGRSGDQPHSGLGAVSAIRPMVLLVFVQSVVLALLLAWAFQISLLLGLVFGILWGSAHAGLLFISKRQGWLRKDFFLPSVRAPQGRKVTLALLIYTIGFALAVGSIIGIVNDLSLIAWGAWFLILILLGVFMAWVLGQV